MKLLIVTPYFYPKIGGVEEHTYNLYKRLSKEKRFEITILTTKHSPELKEIDYIEGMKVYRLPFQFKISNTPVSFRWIKQIKKVIESESPDLIMAHSPVPFLADLVVLINKDIPIILKYHSGSMKKPRGFFTNILISFYEKLILRNIINKVDHLICTSDFVKENSLKEFSSKSSTITPGVDTNKFKPLIFFNKNSPAILYVGRIDRTSRWKGIRHLIDAFLLVKKAIPSVRLSIVGGGDDLEYQKEYAKKLDLQDSVNFYGPLKNEKLVERYQNSELLVLPSTTESESFGMVLIEAMACGLPVVGSNIGGIPYVIRHGENGLLVPPGNPVSLAEAIIKIVNNPQLAKKMGEYGYQLARENYTWDQQVAKTKELIENVHKIKPSIKSTRNKIFSAILVFWLITNLLIFLNFQYLNLKPIFSFTFLTTIPGLLLILILKIRKIGFWEYVVYSIGLSITFLMLGGLLVNWILPLAGITHPLSFFPIFISLTILLIILGGIAYLRNSDLSYKFKFVRMSILNWFFTLIPIVFPILSALGAVSLNNNGPNTITLVMLGGIAVYISFLVIFRGKINRNIYPFSIFNIALSLLFITSLRGWYITGHDIQEEFYIFQLTKNNYYWNIALFRDPYNACLSLNILPTIFSSIVKINDLYIYKVLFQIIFSFSAVGIYLLIRKYTSKILAFLSAFLFVTFPTFLYDMPMLNRQEIALLFFTLILLLLFNKNLGQRLKEVLFLTFGFSMVVSHYSTSYVAIAFLVFTYLVSFVLKQSFINQKIRLGNNNYYLSFIMIAGIILFTFFWNTQLTKTSESLTHLVTETWQNIGKTLNQDLKSVDIQYSIFSWNNKVDKVALLNNYVKDETNRIKSYNDSNLFFGEDVYAKYKITLVDEVTLPLTSLGNKLKSLNLDPFLINYYFKQGSAKIIQLLLVIGFAVVVLKKDSYTKNIDTEYFLIAFAAIILMGLFILLPFFSLEYGTLRFFQQTLVVLALPTIIGSLTVFKFLGKNASLYVTAGFFLIFFLSLSGFIPQLTGGFYPLMGLDNEGSYYEAYYTHKSEVDAREWLSSVFTHQFPVQAGYDASPRILLYSGFDPIRHLLPVTIQKNSYIYLDYLTVKNQKDTFYINGVTISYNYPLEFLNENKNLVYNNNSSRVYK